MNNFVSNYIEVLDDHFIRLRFGISHIKTNYVKKSGKWKLRDNFSKKYNSQKSCLYFNHIDLTLKQDCALSIYRLLDKRTDVISMKSLIESIETNENLVKEYNSICGLSEFNKIKELRNKKLGHISEENVETSANENDLIVLYDRLKIYTKELVLK